MSVRVEVILNYKLLKKEFYYDSVGVDVSRRKSTAAILNVQGEVIYSLFEFRHTQSGFEELLSWLNNEIVQLGEENFFHAAYEETLAPVYGEAANADSIVIEGGQLQ